MMRGECINDRSNHPVDVASRHGLFIPSCSWQSSHANNQGLDIIEQGDDEGVDIEYKSRNYSIIRLDPDQDNCTWLRVKYCSMSQYLSV